MRQSICRTLAVRRHTTGLIWMAWLISKALMMDYENSHCSPVLVGESSAANCLAGEQFAPLNVTPTPHKFWHKDKTIEFSNLSQFGLTCKLLTADHGAALLTWYLAASHAKTYQSPEKARASMATGPACGFTSRGLLAKYDQNSHTLRTVQQSLLTDLSECLQIWPDWGCLLNGDVFERPALVHVITGIDFLWLLTPTAQSWKAWTFKNPFALVRTNHADGNLQEQLMRLYQRMTTPECQEILLGWPEAWTDLKPLETGKFQEWQRQLSTC